MSWRNKFVRWLVASCLQLFAKTTDAEWFQDMAFTLEQRPRALCGCVLHACEWFLSDGRERCSKLDMNVAWLQHDVIRHTLEEWAAPLPSELFQPVEGNVLRYHTADGSSSGQFDAYWFGYTLDPDNHEHRMTFLAMMMAVEETGDFYL